MECDLLRQRLCVLEGHLLGVHGGGNYTLFQFLLVSQKPLVSLCRKLNTAFDGWQGHSLPMVPKNIETALHGSPYQVHLALWATVLKMLGTAVLESSKLYWILYAKYWKDILKEAVDIISLTFWPL